MKNLCTLLALAALALGTCRAPALTNLFATHFEAAEGYDPNAALAGQNSWMSDKDAPWSNGLMTNYLGTQAAYLGYYPPTPANWLYLWHPLNFSPLASGMPRVTFSVLMTIYDSTSTNRDDFYWSVYNAQGDHLFTLDFYNADLGIYYALDDTNGLIYTGVTFTNDTAYTLQVTMDFARNAWSANLDGTALATNLPITTTNAPLNLGDIDAAWIIADPNAPGDNYLVFDNYQVTAEATPSPQAIVQSLGPGGNGSFLLQVSGPSGWRYAVEATTNLVQWLPLKTNTITDGSFDFIDTGAAGSPQRFYRARLVP